MLKLETKKNCGCGQDPCVTFGKKKLTQAQKVDEACWKGYKAYGMKKKGGKMVPNCKPVGSVKEASAVLDANKKLETERKTKKDKAELAKLTHIYKGMKKGIYNSYEPEGNELKEYSPNVTYQAKGGRKSGKLGKSSVYSLKDKGESKKEFRKSQVKDIKGGYLKTEERELDERTLSSYIPSDRQGEASAANREYVKSQLKKKEDESTKNRGDLSKRDAGKMAKQRLHNKKIMSMGEAEEVVDEGKKKGLWDNIHAKRKRGEKPAKPGDKDYPKTLNVEGLEKARKNVGADKCWDGYKAKGTKKKGGKEVPNCVKEGAAWTKKSGKNPEGGLNEKGRKSYERENPGSDLKAPQPEGGSRKKSFCARMGGMKKKLTSAKTANDPDSRINKSLRKWKCNEEDKAFNYVVAKLKAKHGDGVLTKRDKIKPQSAADKAKVRAHQAKVDKENAAERAKDPSQGRYPKG